MNMKLNNRGYFLSFAGLLMFFLVILLVLSMLPEMVRMLSATRDAELAIERYIENRNLDERLLALMNANPSFEGIVNYLGEYGNVEIVEKNTVLQSISISDHLFEINNATDLLITLTPGPMVTISSANLYYDGVVVASLSGSTIQLNSNHFYDKSSGQTKYGEYLLSISSTDNNNVNVNVSFDRVIQREVEIRYGKRSYVLRFTY